jgi:small-conductance mechanosensitive channel
MIIFKLNSAAMELLFEHTIFKAPLTLYEAALWGIYLAGGIVAGLIVEKVILVWLKKLASHTRWKFDDILVGSLRNLLIWAGTFIGLYLGLEELALKPGVMIIVNKSYVVLIILWITLYVTRIVNRLIRSTGAKNSLLLPSMSILTNLARIVIYVVGLLVALQSLKIPITPILTALGVGGLAVALALQGTLSNLFAGIQLLASNHIRPGDYVQLESGDEGYIQDITWRSTVIKALANREIIIPNSQLASATLKNFTLPDPEIAVLVNMSVAYPSDLRKVESVTIDEAAKTMQQLNFVIEGFTPLIRYNTFGDSGIGFTVIMRVRQYVDRYILLHEFVKNIQERYKAEGIEIPYPVRVVKLQSEKPAG